MKNDSFAELGSHVSFSPLQSGSEDAPIEPARGSNRMIYSTNQSLGGWLQSPAVRFVWDDRPQIVNPLAEQGETAGARREFTAALALNSDSAEARAALVNFGTAQ